MRQSGRPRNSGDGGVIRPENIMRLLSDAEPPSRAELAQYFEDCASACLTHLGRRPLTLVRCVEGVTFFHKGPLPPLPGAVRVCEVAKRDGSIGRRPWVDDLAGLIGLVEIGAVELHPWGATVDDVEQADRLVFDLDPDAGVSWLALTRTALALRDFLASSGLTCWPKTTGGKGLHVIVPLSPGIAWPEARRVSRSIAEAFGSAEPEGRTAISGPGARRGGKVFVDWLRNGCRQSAIGAMSPRARRGGPRVRPAILGGSRGRGAAGAIHAGGDARPTAPLAKFLNIGTARCRRTLYARPDQEPSPEPYQSRMRTSTP